MTARWKIEPIERIGDSWWTDWDRVNDAHLQSHPLLSARWARCLAEFFGPNDLKAAQCQDGDKIVAAALVHPNGLGRWRIFCPAQAAVGLVVFAREVWGIPLMENLLRSLPGFGLSLDTPYQDAPYSCLGSEHHPSVHRVSLGTTITLDSPHGFDNYWNDRPKELRDNVRRRSRKASEEGLQPRLEAITDPASIGAAVDRYGELESRGWKGKEGTALHATNQQGRFYRTLMETYAQTGDACVYELYMKDSLAASRIVVSGRTMHVILKTTFDETLRNYAPGHLQLHEILRRLLGVPQPRAIELYTKATRDWLLWASRTRSIDDATIYRGRLVANLAARRRGKTVAPATVPASAGD